MPWKVNENENKLKKPTQNLVEQIRCISMVYNAGQKKLKRKQWERAKVIFLFWLSTFMT